MDPPSLRTFGVVQRRGLTRLEITELPLRRQVEWGERFGETSWHFMARHQQRDDSTFFFLADHWHYTSHGGGIKGIGTLLADLALWDFDRVFFYMFSS